MNTFRSFMCIIGLCFVVLSWSCRSPHKNFEKGNYEKAYHGLVKELEKGSKKRKDRNLLNSAFREMVQQHNVETELLLRSRDVRDWETAYRDSEELLEDYIQGKRWLDEEFDKIITNLDRAQDSLALDIADSYMQLGDKGMSDYNKLGDKSFAQDAYRAYLKVEQYKGGDAYLSDLIENAREEATVHVLFLTEVWDRDLEWLIDRTFSRLERQGNTFLKVDYSGSTREPDCVVELDFGRLESKLSEQRTTDNFSRDIIIRYETVKDTSGTVIERPVYKTVTASVVKLFQRKTYSWRLRSRINQSANYCRFRSRNFSSDFSVEARSYITRGDERALPDNMKNLRDERFDLNENRIVEDMAEDLFQQVREAYF